MSKYWFLSLLCVTTLIFVGCSTKEEVAPPSIPVESKIEEDLMYPTLQNAPRVEDSINRLGSVVKEDPTYRACISQSVQTCGNETISRLSHTKEDDSACNMFEDATLKTTCINTINTTLATKKVDAKYCIKLENTAKINCENQVTVLQAIMAKDQSLCEKIVLTNTTLSGSEALQDPLNEANDPKSQCLMRVITASKPSTESIKACDAIWSLMIRNNCKMTLQSQLDMMRAE